MKTVEVWDRARKRKRSPERRRRRRGVQGGYLDAPVHEHDGESHAREHQKCSQSRHRHRIYFGERA
eukprot:180826-Hanusia_phi.AAC.15